MVMENNQQDSSFEDEDSNTSGLEEVQTYYDENNSQLIDQQVVERIE